MRDYIGIMENTMDLLYSYQLLCWDNGKSNGKCYIKIRGYSGIMENETETAILVGYIWSYIGIMEHKMETIIL